MKHLVTMGIVVYVILRLLYWLTSTASKFWETEWLITEKILPIFLLYYIAKGTTGWTRIWSYYGICVCVFMAIYSLMHTYKINPGFLKDYMLVGIFFGYSLVMILLLYLPLRR